MLQLDTTDLFCMPSLYAKEAIIIIQLYSLCYSEIMLHHCAAQLNSKLKFSELHPFRFSEQVIVDILMFLRHYHYYPILLTLKPRPFTIPVCVSSSQKYRTCCGKKWWLVCSVKILVVQRQDIVKSKAVQLPPCKCEGGEGIYFLVILDLGTKSGEWSASRLGRALPIG
jgi:hypothetical protein